MPSSGQLMGFWSQGGLESLQQEVRLGAVLQGRGAVTQNHGAWGGFWGSIFFLSSGPRTSGANQSPRFRHSVTIEALRPSLLKLRPPHLPTIP
jgi:hypothetical protein